MNEVLWSLGVCSSMDWLNKMMREREKKRIYVQKQRSLNFRTPLENTLHPDKLTTNAPPRIEFAFVPIDLYYKYSTLRAGCQGRSSWNSTPRVGARSFSPTTVLYVFPRPRHLVLAPSFRRCGSRWGLPTHISPTASA
jgi:hypothetical protein